MPLMRVGQAKAIFRIVAHAAEAISCIRNSFPNFLIYQKV